MAEESSLLSLAGRAAVVTGASSGIGRAIALALAGAGADVLVHARANEEGANRTASEVTAQGRQSRVSLCDLSDTDTHAALVEHAFGWRPIDIWVNNAGVDVLTGSNADLGFDAKLELLWQVDVRATIALSRLAGKRMQERGGGVVLNIGWDQTASGMAGDSGEMFAAVKAAVEAFSRSLAKSLAPVVRVNCIAPGWIKTQWGEQASESWQQRAVHEALLARWGLPEDVAQMARFLASDASSFITGQTLAVNGGAAGRD